MSAKTGKSTQPIYYYGTGRRKTAIARVRLYEKGSGKLVINDNEEKELGMVNLPLELVGQQDIFDIRVRVTGGGKNGQLEAIRLGVARALIKLNVEWRQALKKAGYLTRDPREKERMKPGLKRARRAPQWAKR